VCAELLLLLLLLQVYGTLNCHLTCAGQVLHVLLLLYFILVW